MSHARIIVFTLLAMLAFAGNSLLCRIALEHTTIHPASFTAIRLISGAVMLWLVVRVRGGARKGTGNWSSALALFAYAAGFSFAYVSLPTATGALLLFGAVQITMISHGMWTGERLRLRQAGGFVLAFAGLIGLLLPGLSAPPLHGAILMLGAGIAWGIYSLRGKGAGDPVSVTAGNFLRTVPMGLALSFLMLKDMSLDSMSLDSLLLNSMLLNSMGAVYAIASGALASGVGYAIWYSALPMLKAITAATVQLSVPLLAAIGGIVFLAEPVTLRLALASVAVLGGIALVILQGRSHQRA